MFSLTWFFVWFTIWEKTHELIESSLYSQSPPTEIFFSSNETPTEWCMPAFVVTVAGSSTPNISQYTSHSYLVCGSHPAPPWSYTFSSVSQSLFPVLQASLYDVFTSARPQGLVCFPSLPLAVGEVILGLIGSAASYLRAEYKQGPYVQISQSISWAPSGAHRSSCTIFLFPYGILHYPCTWNLHGICSLWHYSQYPELKSGPKMGEWVGK